MVVLINSLYRVNINVNMLYGWKLKKINEGNLCDAWTFHLYTLAPLLLFCIVILAGKLHGHLIYNLHGTESLTTPVSEDS